MAGYWSTLVNAQIDGTAVTAAATPTSCIPLASRYTLAANYFDFVGKQLLVKASGRISSLITTPGTATYDVRFGATKVWDGLAILLDTVAAHTTVGWKFELLLTCRAIGNAGNLWGQGTWTCEDILGVPATAPKGCLTAILPWNLTPAIGSNFDTTVTQQVDFFFTQAVGTGTMTVHQYSLIAMHTIL